jgi:hypothetical protein
MLEVKPGSIANSETWQTETGAPVVEPVDDGGVRWRQSIVLNPLAPGRHSVALTSWRFRDGPGAWQTVNWKPIRVVVTTTITKADVKDLRDITDIEMSPTPASNWHWILVLGPLVALILVVIALWKWRRHSVNPAPPPEQWALRELDRIAALNLPAVGKMEDFHGLLANIIRRYLENRFGLPARRQTTPEFLRSMEASTALTDSQRALLRIFLERCDHAKFARARPSAAECGGLLELARGFVQANGVRLPAPSSSR